MLKAAHIPPYFKQMRSAHVAGGHPALSRKKSVAAAMAARPAQRNDSSYATSTALIRYVPPSRHIESGVRPAVHAAPGAAPWAVAASPVEIASALPAFTCSPFGAESPCHVTFAPLPDMAALRAAHKATQKSLFAKAWSTLVHASNRVKTQVTRAFASMWLAVAAFLKAVAHRS